MKIKIVILSILMVIPLASIGQSRIVTPFTPREINADGQKEYVKVQPGSSRRAITVGYGFMPASSINSFANSTLIYTHPGSGKRTAGDITSSMGTISIGFSYEFTPWLELNIPLVYSKNWGTQPHHFKNATTKEWMSDEGYLRDNWFSLIPNVRINWMRNDWLSLYSRVGVGIALANRNRGIDNDLYSAPAFVWQFSPVGAEFGRKVCFFIEGGFGYTGVVTGGVKFKVGKMLKDGTMSNGRQVEWYEKYMKY